MKIYNLIADNYEYIFPLERKKIDFIRKLCPPPADILDAGCATGELALTLSQAGYRVSGIDLNPAMINRAKQSVVNLRTDAAYKNTAYIPPDFTIADMRLLNRSAFYNALLCFGNTLVHLADKDEVFYFFTSVYKSLKSGGVFIFQILNYDKILAERTADFKIIENRNFIFKRRYNFSDCGKIIFTIDFTDIHCSKTYTDSTLLLPLTQKEIVFFLKRAGFTAQYAYSDYQGSKSDLSEFSTIYTAQK